VRIENELPNGELSGFWILDKDREKAVDVAKKMVKNKIKQHRKIT